MAWDGTDDTGAVSDAYEYDVFGNVRAESGSSTNEFTCTGEQVDETGLQYLRARYYDPATGRFISQDPFSGFDDQPATQNPYAYALNNPCNVIDPSGAVAAESGFSVVVCHANVVGYGVGARDIPLCTWGWCPSIDWFPNGWDVLFEFDAWATFVTGPDGSTTVGLETRDPSGNLGWHARGGHEATGANYAWATRRYDTYGRILLGNNSASLGVAFGLDANGDGRVRLSTNGFGGALSSLLSYRTSTKCVTLQ